MAVWSEVKRTNLVHNNRFDAEFYRPEYLDLENAIKSISHVRFGSIIETLTDYHANGSYENLRNHVRLLDNGGYAYMVRTADLEANDFEKDVKYIDEHAYHYLKKTQIFGYEILINKIGSAGKVYLMPKLDKPVSLGMNLFMIRTIKDVSTFYIFAYFYSKYGRRYIERYVNGTVPLTITKDSVRSVLVPLLPKKLHDEITLLVSKSMCYMNSSKELYHSAKDTFYKKAGFNKLNLIKTKSYGTSFSEIVIHNRIDADYYQKHFKLMANYLDSISTELLGDLVNFTKGIEVGTQNYTNSGKLFIRVSNVKETGIVTGNSDKYISEKLYNKLLEFKPKIGDILLTKDGTLGECYVVDSDVEGIISGGIMKMTLKSSSIPAEYLSLAINSTICKLQIERVCSGALIQHWKPKDISALKIPILDKAIMEELSELVISAKKAKKESKRLLEQAKRKVEDFIERGYNDEIV
jgi:type I restriction enzyme S subunit